MDETSEFSGRDHHEAAPGQGWRGTVSGCRSASSGRKLTTATNGRGLRATQRASLKRDGYLLVPSLLDGGVLVRIRHRLAELVRQTTAAWQAGRNQDIAERGVVRVQLDLADAGFAPCHEHRLLADAATTVLGAGWHLAALNLRAPLPGSGHQGLHPDFEQRRIGEPWQTLSAMWAITAFTADNGPLRVIPGSHRVSEPPIDMQAWGSGMGPHPEEVRVTAPAGSVILFNSADLWHSGTFNYSPEPRLAVIAGFAPGRC
jgi:ectoine hydroxylase-related dioxygenase (phytanoyl-CoA dioxygenase family)